MQEQIGKGVYDDFDYDVCIDVLAEWIDALGWAYIPLEYEAEYALFVTASDRKDLVTKVRQRLLDENLGPVFEVATVQGRQRWMGPPMLGDDEETL